MGVVERCVMEIDGWRLEWVGSGRPEPVQPRVWGCLLASALLAVESMAGAQMQASASAGAGAAEGAGQHQGQLTLLDELAAPVQPDQPAHEGDLVVVQPRHGWWPHPRGKWRDDEREAAFEMRHRWGVSDRDLARIVGAARQAINVAIGDKTAPHRDIWPDQLKWRPSAELLRRCGIYSNIDASANLAN